MSELYYADSYIADILNTVQTIAMVGASPDWVRPSHFAMKYLQSKGYRVIPVNPNEPEVEGHPTFKSVVDIPGEVHLATIYVPGRVGVTVMDDVAKKGIAEVWLNPGADDPAVVRRAKELGLKTVQTCSILAIGESPSRY